MPDLAKRVALGIGLLEGVQQALQGDALPEVSWQLVDQYHEGLAALADAGFEAEELYVPESARLLPTGKGGIDRVRREVLTAKVVAALRYVIINEAVEQLAATLLAEPQRIGFEVRKRAEGGA